jgi:pimeloyl-ACP methyl ester carboxylesterase
MLMKFLFPIAACVALLFSGCGSVARRTVLPGSYLTPPKNIVSESPGYELVALRTAAGTKIVAQFGGALDPTGQSLPRDPTRPTVLFFYGNRMCLAASQQIFEDLRRMGVDVLIPEYPGYGMSGGVASEQECYAAADAALHYLSTRPDIDPHHIVVAGLSIGCGPAVDLAARNPVAGVVLVVPLTNIQEIGSDLTPWYLRWAVPLLAHYAAFDNLGKIPQVKAPILIVRATRDQVTSSKRSEELVAAAKTRIASVAVDADHDGSWRAGRNEIERWLRATFPPDSAALGERKPIQTPSQPAGGSS